MHASKIVTVGIAAASLVLGTAGAAFAVNSGSSSTTSPTAATPCATAAQRLARLDTRRTRLQARATRLQTAESASTGDLHARIAARLDRIHRRETAVGTRMLKIEQRCNLPAPTTTSPPSAP